MTDETRRGGTRFRILSGAGSQILATYTCADVTGSIDLERIRSLLPDYRPDSVCILKVSLATDDAVEVEVGGERRKDRENYRVISPPED